MKYRSPITFIASLLVLFLQAKPLYAQKEKLVVNFGANPECPYICSGSPSAPGYIVEILSSAFKENDIKLNIISYPYPRLKMSLRQYDMDIIVLPSFEIRNDFDLVSLKETVGVHFLGVAYLGKKQSFSRLRNLSNKLVLLTGGSHYSQVITDSLDSYNKDNNLVSAVSGTQVEERKVRMLLTGRAEVILSDYNIISNLIGKKYFRDSIQLSTSSFAGFTPIVVVMKKENIKFKTLNTVLSQYIKKIRNNGELKNILKKYNIPDWNIYSAR